VWIVVAAVRHLVTGVKLVCEYSDGGMMSPAVADYFVKARPWWCCVCAKGTQDGCVNGHEPHMLDPKLGNLEPRLQANFAVPWVRSVQPDQTDKTTISKDFVLGQAERHVNREVKFQMTD
jgi:hypothetical protein